MTALSDIAVGPIEWSRQTAQWRPSHARVEGVLCMYATNRELSRDRNISVGITAGRVGEGLTTFSVGHTPVRNQATRLTARRSLWRPLQRSVDAALVVAVPRLGCAGVW